MYKSKLTPEQKEELDQEANAAIDQYGMAGVIDALANRFDKKSESLGVKFRADYRKMSTELRDLRNEILEADFLHQSQERS